MGTQENRGHERQEKNGEGGSSKRWEFLRNSQKLCHNA